MMRKTQTDRGDSWPVYMYFPSDLYFRMKRKVSEEGYTKRELQSDHHVKDYIISLLESIENNRTK